MEVLVLDDKRYVKASKAAKAAGYTSDYVGQLCRSGKVDAHLVGRSWYVNEDELGTHRMEKKRNSRVKAREQVRKAVTELKEKKQNDSDVTHIDITTGRNTIKNFEKRGIRYESDESDLLPAVRKLKVDQAVSTTYKSKKRRVTPARKAEKEPGYVIENEGNKVKMSGVLSVVDATDEDLLDGNTVLLHAKIEKKKPKIPKRRTIVDARAEIDDEIGKDADIEIPMESESSSEASKTDFLTKLAVLGEEETKEVEDGEVMLQEPLSSSEMDDTRHYFIVPFTLAIGIALLTLSVVIENNWTYSNTGTAVNTSSALTIDFKSALHKISLKF